MKGGKLGLLRKRRAGGEVEGSELTGGFGAEMEREICCVGVNNEYLIYSFLQFSLSWVLLLPDKCL